MQRDKEKMEQFLRKLSERCKTLEGGEAFELLSDKILKDPLLDE
jgi:hypothetical protein